MTSLTTARSGARICLAAAPGGHLCELLAARQVFSLQDHFYVVSTAPTELLTGIGKVYVVLDYGTVSVLKRAVNLLRLARTSLNIFLEEWPDILITTGPMTGWFIALLTKVTGGKIIYIECSAQVTTPSLSGRFYYQISDHFFVQWPALLKYYPRATCIGLII